MLFILNNVMIVVVIRYLVFSRVFFFFWLGKRFVCFCIGIGFRGTEVSIIKVYWLYTR